MEYCEEERFLSVPSFYREELQDKKIYEKDLELLSRQWNFVDHISSFKKTGDYKVYELLGKLIVIVKTDEGFEGGRNYSSEEKGEFLVGSIVESILNHENRFKHVMIKELEGILLVGLSHNKMANFSRIRSNIEPLYSWHGLKQAKIAHKEKYTINANWKAVSENLLECYHCYANHPEMCSIANHPTFTSTASLDKMIEGIEVFKNWSITTKSMNHPVGERQNVDVDAEQFSVIYRAPINVNQKSHSKDGNLLAPLMGSISQCDNGETFGYIGPLTVYSMPNDYAYILRINPLTVKITEVELFWLVDNNAVENKDYNIDQLTWYWNSTVQQDKVAIDRAGKGTSSRYYSPGNYTSLEEESARFALWYRKQIMKM
ncbi:SRPBCC family protein [Colwellia sp. Bg11-28]|uniref:SRPBCC family protein n=1 Tax=Colwellia sp. Bg11-28 TaxID=2058305 RepID=UPI000C341990|nr:SRPBCC family protein [Colwellia sp. Bg11-28]PKH85426.1 hypothetical protein CXF79_19375 [Colwellia sp. Bg11-28]